MKQTVSVSAGDPIRVRNEKRNAQRVIVAATLYYPNIGGVENSLYYLGQSYRKLGLRPWLFASNGGTSEVAKECIQLSRRDRIPLLRYRFSSSALIRAIRAYIAFRLLISRREVAVVISRDQHSAVAATLLRLPCVYLVPGITSLQHRPTGYNPLRWLNHLVAVALQRVALRRVDSVAVFSEGMVRAVEREAGRRDVHHVLPGVDASRFHVVDEYTVRDRRRQLGINEESKLAICVGRFSRQKRFDLAIEAMARVPSNWHLILVGDGPLREELETLIQRLGLENRVTITGKISNPEYYLQMSDVFVLSSDYEPFGQVLIEALACGLMVAAFDPSLPGVDTATSEIVPVHWLAAADSLSGEALAKAMEIAGSIVRDRAAVSKWTLNTFSWSALAEELLRISGPA